MYWTAGLKQIAILLTAAAVQTENVLEKNKLVSIYSHNLVLLYQYPHIITNAIKSRGPRIHNLFQIMNICH